MPQAVSNVDRDRLIGWYVRDEDYVRLAASLGINRRTANGIITTFVRKGWRHELPRGWSSRQIFTEQMRQALIDFVEEKPTATLNKMKAKLLHLFLQSPSHHDFLEPGRPLDYNETCAQHQSRGTLLSQAGSTRFRHLDDGHRNSPKPHHRVRMQQQSLDRKDSGATSQRLTSCSHS